MNCFSLGVGISFLLAFTAAGAETAAVMPREGLWSEDLDRGVAVDQAQWRHSAYMATGRVGQTFLATGQTLARIDLMVKNRTDMQPGTIQVWPWRGDYGKTVAGEPVFADVLDLSGPDLPQVRHFFPRIRVEAGKTYFLETCKTGQAASVMYLREDDDYAGGMMFTGSTPRPDWDIAFATFNEEPRAKPTAAYRPLAELPHPSWEPPLPLREPVTRGDYLELVRRYVEANRAGWLRSDGKHGGRAAFYFAFLYKATGEEQWAQWATDRLRTTGQWLDSHPDEAIGFPWLPPVCMAYAWIRDSQSLEANDHEVIRRTLLAAARRHWPLRERGAMNRSMGSALGYSLLARLFPDEADVPTWRQYAESVWNDWYEQADTDEDSLHYNALWWEYVITYARENGLESMYARPEIRRLIERYREQVSPLGPLPPYGDCYGWGFSWGGWVLLFEKAAAVYGDGSYRWAAERVFDYVVRHAKETPPYQITYEDMWRVALAWIVARDDLPPTAPPRQSKLLSRKQPLLLPVPRRKAEKTWFHLSADDIPDKLVLRSPGDGLFAVFDLMPLAGHGHCDAPALVALTAGDTALLTDTAYNDRTAEDHSLVRVLRLRGGDLKGKPPQRVEVNAFVERPEFTWCRVETTDYSGWDVQLAREIFFAKDRFLWIGDEVQLTQAMEAIVGPLWYAAEATARGPNWFDVVWNEPRGFRWKWRNGRQHLLVYFVPRDEAVVDYQYQPWKTQRAEHDWSPPLCLYQKIRCGPAVSGGPIRFDTLLIPHPPTQDPAVLAAGIRSERRTDSRRIEISLGSETLRARVEVGVPALERISEPR